MSVRVNLLPAATKERDRAGRQRLALGGSLLTILLLLGAAYVFQISRVNDREASLAAEQDATNQLLGELGELHEFADLEQRRDLADGIVAASMAGEVSFAGLLQDVASVIPSSTWLETLNVSLDEEPMVPLGAHRPTIARLSATGLEANGHAPGLENLLLAFDKVFSFDNVFFTESTTVGDEQDFVGGDGDESTFSLELDIAIEARTDRYLDGVPEVLR